MTSNGKRVFLVGGGTGGHLYPLFSVGKVFIDKGYDVFFLGKSNVSNIKAEDFFIKHIPLELFPLKTIKGIIYFFISFFKSIYYLFKYKPELIIAAGAYFSLPTSIAAILFNKPLFLLEQNVIPGKAVRFLSKFCKLTFVNFKDTKYLHKSKVVVCGNPVRDQFFNFDINKALNYFSFKEDIFTLFIFGASQGAKRLNEVLFNLLSNESFLYFPKIQIIHIVGPKLYQDYMIKLKGVCIPDNINYKIFAFLKDIHFAYFVSDLVVSRSGATTLTELDLLQKHAILIPFPYATDNHQYYNALAFKKDKEDRFIEIILEKELTQDLLLDKIKDFYLNYYLKGRNKNLNNKLKDKEHINAQHCIYKNIIKNLSKKEGG